MKKIHLICNAHIDPVWQWDVAEGIGAALSTFRSAADFCDEYDDFIFNHNEALLYRLVEEYEPELFERIKKHVKAGKWHIMGGFELQPDCVMPQGETYIRQILRGRKYFGEKFGIYPTTAINFDSFGHSRGMAQILKKSGFDAYIFMRPEAFKTTLPKNFIWEGFDGSQIYVHRLTTCYNSLMGENAKELKGWFGCLEATPEPELYTWGVGNHGGGPSRKDIEDINDIRKNNELSGAALIHSTPEAFFAELKKEELPVINRSLYSSNTGCYTSMLDVKQRHRKLENQLLIAEKMASAAALAGMEYPRKDLDKAFEALSYIQFHDVLPGTMIETAKKSMMNKAGFGLEIAANVINKAFYKLSSGQPKALPDTIPVLAFNPHPYRVETILSCEYMLANQNWDKTKTTVAKVVKNGDVIPSQIECEESMVPLDWRKRITFKATLEPMSMNRFDCVLKVVSKKEKVADDKDFSFDNGLISLMVSKETGLIEKLEYKAKTVSGDNFGRIAVFADNCDPWHMESDKIENKLGEFTLMSAENAKRFLDNASTPVHITEDGDVRTVIEALFEYNKSYAVVKYYVPKSGAEIGVNIEIINNEQDKMIKLALPLESSDIKVLSETMFGAEEAVSNGSEFVSHRFDVINPESEVSLGVINDCTYGGSIINGVLYKNLLRSPAYCAHPIEDRAILPQDRYVPRMEQGRSVFDFAFIPGDKNTGLYAFAKSAQLMNEKPVVVSFFPPGAKGDLPFGTGVNVEGNVLVTAVKKSENGDAFIVRIFEPAGQHTAFKLTVPKYNISFESAVSPFEIKTLSISDGLIKETDLTEKQ